ncbi:unnamed protein product [Schistosoma curassoni]|nr:unnamed protein product [Schistosoma curassoni]
MWNRIVYCMHMYPPTVWINIYNHSKKGVMIQTNIHSINDKNIGQYLSISTGWGIAKIIGLLISTNSCGGGGGGGNGDGDGDNHDSSSHGWGIQAFKANNYYFWLPLIGPYIGAIIGSLFYGFIISLHIIPSSDIDQYKIQNNQCTIINSTSNYLQSSFIEEMNEDLFNITEIDDCFIDSEETID